MPSPSVSWLAALLVAWLALTILIARFLRLREVDRIKERFAADLHTSWRSSARKMAEQGLRYPFGRGDGEDHEKDNPYHPR